LSVLLDTRKYLENDFYFIIPITVLDRYLRILRFLYQKLLDQILMHNPSLTRRMVLDFITNMYRRRGMCEEYKNYH
jgi:hypothetical protein